ncbi:uncharacterized protein DFL_008333 [Arthrobotrys flagrans]|uniref:Uncharacterized protein n=1 Tax=Arthrobotrys flagrans TaxID=97331 RepID=A0A436ZNK6_ARTFL|nr:hypothetical protein DFL_008333 [Arthrobotrys flagrans]
MTGWALIHVTSSCSSLHRDYDVTRPAVWALESTHTLTRSTDIIDHPAIRIENLGHRRTTIPYKISNYPFLGI